MQFAHDANRRNERPSIILAMRLLALAILLGAIGDNVARAQTATAKIAVANPSVIFDEIQETKDFVTKMTNDLNAFKAEQAARVQKLKDQQNQREMFKQDSPQYAEADQKLLDMTYEYELYVQVQTQKLQRARKKQIIALFDKITAAVTKVAETKKLDLVVADVRPSLPAQGTQDFEQLTENQIKSVLAQRNVLYNSKPIDITSDVIALMDADYKAGK